MKKILIIAAAIIATACSTGPKKLSPEMQAAYERPLICESEEQCDLFWERSLFYINKNSPYKVQTATDNLIQTFTATGGTTNVGYNVSREPLGNNSYRLWVTVACDNMFGCYPAVNEEIANFKLYVRNEK